MSTVFISTEVHIQLYSEEGKSFLDIIIFCCNKQIYTVQ